MRWRLSPDQRRRGVIADVGGGNHAQGRGLYTPQAAPAFPPVIVMPVGTPMVKIENTRRHDAEIVISRARRWRKRASLPALHAKSHDMILIHPYDDPLIIAGQGTIGLEMLEAVADLDTLVVPIGGGGLISGIAVAAKSLRPDIRIVGVQAGLYPVDVRNAVKKRTTADARRYAGRKASRSRRRDGASPPASFANWSTRSCW